MMTDFKPGDLIVFAYHYDPLSDEESINLERALSCLEKGNITPSIVVDTYYEGFADKIEIIDDIGLRWAYKQYFALVQSL